MPINFRKAHKIGKGMMYELCRKCGGKCEKDGKALLLPGEEIFIAESLGIPVKSFAAKYCSVIRSKKKYIYLLKAGNCPFLNSAYRCELERCNCKPLLCLLYPTCISFDGETVKMAIDYEECPMAKKISKDFTEKARKVIGSIKKDIPRWWLNVDFGDEETGHFDYSKLEKLRNKKVLDINEWRQCIEK